MESSAHQPHTINSTSVLPALHWRHVSRGRIYDTPWVLFPLFFIEYMFCCVWSEYCSVGYIITDSTVANSAQPCFTESFTNVRVKSTQGDTGSVAAPMCILHSKSSLTVFRISSLCRCNKNRQFLKQKKTLAGWHQHCSAAASRSSNATKTALERIWSLNHSWLKINYVVLELYFMTCLRRSARL